MKNFKLTVIALAIVLFAYGGAAYASFPVKKATKQEQPEKQQNASDQTLSNTETGESLISANEKTNIEAAAPNDLDEKWILVILWFFLGGLAAHRWYKKKPTGWNILFILTLGGCGIWAIVDLVNILTDNF